MVTATRVADEKSSAASLQESPGPTKFTEAEIGQLSERFGSALQKAIDGKRVGNFRYPEDEKVLIKALLSESFEELLRDGWASISYSATFKRALEDLEEEGIRLGARQVKLYARNTRKLSNEMLHKIGIKHRIGYYIDRGKFISDMCNSVLELKEYKQQSKYTVLEFLFRENNIGAEEVRAALKELFRN